MPTYNNYVIVMAEPLREYHIKVKFLEDLRYGEFITAPSEEEAIKLFLEEYVYVTSKPA